MNENTFPSLKEYVIEKKLGVGTYASVYKARSKAVNWLIQLIIFRDLIQIYLFMRIRIRTSTRPSNASRRTRWTNRRPRICYARSKYSNKSNTNTLSNSKTSRFCHLFFLNRILWKTFLMTDLIKWDESYIYLIMEYCPGGDLSSFIKSRRTIPEKYVRRFVQQIGILFEYFTKRAIDFEIE